ncbi:odorant receptor 131-2-like [Hyperolius riggenbachi]|uniref:odorant receptor 131-2-like n=1 Tax=Hyperolius riggenbachi TaxID=752182 RepID=UPI0035A31F4C
MAEGLEFSRVTALGMKDRAFSMPNNTNIPSNVTNDFTASAFSVGNVIYLIVLITTHCIFLCFVGVMLHVFFINAQFKETSRYVLFIHMVLNDTLHLLLSFLLYVAFTYNVYMPVPACYLLLALGTSSFRISPYSLAAMCLERYVAVCFPLRHLQLCTLKRSFVAIAVLWMVSLIYYLADFVELYSAVDKKFFSLNVLCKRVSLTRTLEQGTIVLCEMVISLPLVGLIITYTYVRVALVARKISSSKSSAMKAGKTIMLHLFQLILYLTAFTGYLTESLLKDKTYISIINYFLFTCFPRFLSLLIYGLRDEAFRKYMFKLCFTGAQR